MNRCWWLDCFPVVISLSFSVVVWSTCSENKKAFLELCVLPCKILFHILLLLTLMGSFVCLWFLISHVILCALTRINLTSQQSNYEQLYCKFKTLFELFCCFWTYYTEVKMSLPQASHKLYLVLGNSKDDACRKYRSEDRFWAAFSGV